MNVSHIILTFPCVCLSSFRFPESGHTLSSSSRNRWLEEGRLEGSSDYASTKRTATRSLAECCRKRSTLKHNVVPPDLVPATSLFGWFHWPSADWGTDGADRGGSEPLLSAGTWKRDDLEGAAERRETEETRGEEDTVRASVSPLKLMFTSGFIPWCSPLSVQQEAEEWAAGDQTKRFPSAPGARGATVRPLPEDFGPDLWPWRSLRGVSAARLQRLPRQTSQHTPVEVQCLCQDLVSVTPAGTKTGRTPDGLD